MSHTHFRNTPFGVVVCQSDCAPSVTELKGDEAEQFRREAARATSDHAVNTEATGP